METVMKSQYETTLNCTSIKAYAKLSLVTAIASVAFLSPTHAQGDDKPVQTSPAKSARSGQSDKLDVSDLEKKYWAAKDTDFSVVQNRLFNKAGRFALTASYGTLINDPWSDGPTFGLGLNYYLSERYGVELDYMNTASTDSQSTSYIKSHQGGAPDHNQVKNFYGAGFNWIPFYAKMSVLNSSIIYFDMSITPGVGMVGYEQQLDTGNVAKSAPAFTLDVTQHFFLNRWLALRADFKNRWYSEDVQQYHVTSGSRTTSSQLSHTTIIMGGVTFYF
jgi:outer membrane beta-barrel protein